MKTKKYLNQLKLNIPKSKQIKSAKLANFWRKFINLIVHNLKMNLIA